MISESELIPYHAVDKLGNGPVLVLAPHPDDEVLGCGGAIMRHVAAGDRVSVVIVTDGGGYLQGARRQEYVDQRRQESLAAALMMGYGEPQFWAYRDRELGECAGEGLAACLREAINASGASLIYAPSPFEVHPDHRALSQATWALARELAPATLVSFYEIGAPLAPNRLLDISTLVTRKQAALACFGTQLAAQDYDRHIKALNTYRTYTLPRAVQAVEAYWEIRAEDCARQPPPLPIPLWSQEMASLRTRVQALEERLAARDDLWRARFEGLTQSRSWRLTAPLRRIARWLHRVT